ncbi:MAG: acylneuraminate cytidylyltransferase family protein [Candidatus Lokiarchaeota archaeon]|nr:acylneuraminate cytidylyltransferase family protein [Candidatus Lokiarchaeota archaeon]
MKIICIIPARGGSKGIKKKNIRMINGIPLIAYTIIEALKCKKINRIIVSTDDKEIAAISKKYGAEVFDRPPELSSDESSTIDAIFNVIGQIEGLKEDSTIILLLQPTSPLRTVLDIEQSINLFLNSECDSIVSVKESEHPPYWTLILEQNYLKFLFDRKTSRRQDYEKTFIPNGAIYIAKLDILKKYNTFYCPKTLPYIMPKERSVDIDQELDILFTKSLMKKNQKQ